MHVTTLALFRHVWFSCICLEPKACEVRARSISFSYVWHQSTRAVLHTGSLLTSGLLAELVFIIIFFLWERKGFKWAYGSREPGVHQVHRAAAASTQQEVESEQEVRRLCVLHQPSPRDTLAPVNLPLFHLPKQRPSQLGPSAQGSEMWDPFLIETTISKTKNSTDSISFFLRCFCYFWKFRPIRDQQTELPVWKLLIFSSTLKIFSWT